MTKITNRQETHQKIFLSVDELKEFGNALTNIMNRLEMTNCAIDGLELAHKKDTASFDWIAKKFLSATHEQNLKIHELLDRIAFQLLECDDEKELRGYAFNSNDTGR